MSEVMAPAHLPGRSSMKTSSRLAVRSCVKKTGAHLHRSESHVLKSHEKCKRSGLEPGGDPVALLFSPAPLQRGGAFQVYDKHFHRVGPLFCGSFKPPGATPMPAVTPLDACILWNRTRSKLKIQFVGHKYPPARIVLPVWLQAFGPLI